jgi:hypothetical protein
MNIEKCNNSIVVLVNVFTNFWVIVNLFRDTFFDKDFQLTFDHIDVEDSKSIQETNDFD